MGDPTVPANTSEDPEQEADPNLREAKLQEQHARNMRAVAHQVAGLPDTLLDASDFLEMARHATCTAATLRGMARR